MTLDELAAMLELPAGHYILALGELPDGHVPGISVTIASGDDAPPNLPRYNAVDPLKVMNLATYRRWGSERAVRSTLQQVEEPLWPAETGCADDCAHPSHRHHERQGRPGRRADDGYVPQRQPTAPSDPVAWPKFPGEGLPITDQARHADPGDEDIHMGGPR